MASSELIKVLIVDDNFQTRENIRSALKFEPSIQVVDVAQNGQEAIELAQKLEPDVIIMDVNMPDMDGLEATERIRRKVPYCQVVILTVQDEPGYMRRAMLAGARDFLSKPPNIDDLLNAVKRAGAMAHAEKANWSKGLRSPGGSVASSAPLQGKVITVYGPKGGCGKTLLATNLAIALQTQNQDSKAILVDGNLQFGDVAIVLNEHVKNSLVDLTVRVDELDPDVVEGVAIVHRDSKLHVLAAPPKPEMALQVTGEQFGKLLRFLRTAYHYVVTDTSSYLSESTEAAIEAADLIVLITTQDLAALKNTSLFLNLTDALGFSRERILLVLNRYDKRINLDAERIANSFKHPVETVIPLDERTALQSVLRGRPFVIEDKNSVLSKAVLNLAEVVKQKLAKLEAPAEQETVSKK